MESTKKITVYGRLSNLNDYTKACRTNRYAGAALKKKNEDIIKSCVLEQIGMTKFDGQVRLDFK